MVFCSKCGNQSPDGMAFCPRCGTKLIVQEANVNGAAQLGVGGGYLPPIPPRNINHTATPGDYAPRPMQPRRNNIPMIAVAVIIGCIIIAAAILVVFPQGNVDGTNDKSKDDGVFDHGIREGDYVNYKVSMTSGSSSGVGTCRISYSNVTATTMMMTTQIEVNAFKDVSNVNLTLVDGVWKLDDPSASVDSGASGDSISTVVIGNETIQTKFGSRDCIHIRSVVSGLVEDDWYYGGCIMKSMVVYPEGLQMTMEITSTNIGGI